jgi:hypothetical protein
MGEKIRTLVQQQWAGLIALFLVLSGGTALATHPGGANTISTGDIINDEVLSADIRDGRVFSEDIADDTIASVDIQNGQVRSADVLDATLTGGDVANNSVTGADVNESSLNLAAEGWHEVGSAGEPAFNQTDHCFWKNFGSPHNTAAFLRDRFGFVHLRGLVDVEDATSCGFVIDDEGSEDELIFNLPQGYRPANRELFATLSNNAPARINVDGPSWNPDLGAGAVSTDEPPTTVTNARQWISLDGMTFRCAPSGSNGCP